MQDPTLHHDEVMKPGDETCHSSDIINMEQTKTHIRRRSMQQSDSRKNLIVETPAIHSSSKSIQRHVVSSSPEANKLVSQSAKPSRSLYKCKGETVESNCSCRSRDTSRWHQHRHHQQGHWSGEEWETEKTGSKNKKSGVCKCLAGTLADCTVVCCCPLSLLHLLALACIKLPSIIVIRTIRKVKAKLKKKRQQQEVRQDDSDRSETPFTPSLSCRESLEDIPWTSTSSFADPKMWQEYFGVDAAGFSQEWCLQCQCTFCTNNSDLRATRSGKLRCPSDEMGWNFLLAFNTVFSYNNSVGPKMWQEYFGADSAGFTQQWHLQCKWAFCTNNLGLCSTRCGKVRCASDGMVWNGMEWNALLAGITSLASTLIALTATINVSSHLSWLRSVFFDLTKRMHQSSPWAAQIGISSSKEGYLEESGHRQCPNVGSALFSTLEESSLTVFIEDGIECLVCIHSLPSAPIVSSHFWLWSVFFSLKKRIWQVVNPQATQFGDSIPKGRYLVQHAQRRFVSRNPGTGNCPNDGSALLCTLKACALVIFISRSFQGFCTQFVPQICL